MRPRQKNTSTSWSFWQIPLVPSLWSVSRRRCRDQVRWRMSARASWKRSDSISNSRRMSTMTGSMPAHLSRRRAGQCPSPLAWSSSTMSYLPSRFATSRLSWRWRFLTVQVSSSTSLPCEPRQQKPRRRWSWRSIVICCPVCNVCGRILSVRVEALAVVVERVVWDCVALVRHSWKWTVVSSCIASPCWSNA